METKQITLRSQTVRCPHCGEYYSVTYKYCPFCDVAREEQEKKAAEKKKHKKALLGSLFGGPEPEPAPKRKKPVREPIQNVPQREPAKKVRDPQENRGTRRVELPQDTVAVESVDLLQEAGKKTPPKKTESVGKKDTGHRRKTSELTEEEKAARRAEREARAAERKRARDRAAREAAVAAAPKIEAGPVFEEVTVPETFGFPADAAPGGGAAFVQTPVSAEGPVVAAAQPDPAVMEEIPVFPHPKGQVGTQAGPEPADVQAQPPEDEAERSRWEFLRQLETVPDAPVVEVSVDGQSVVVTQPGAEAAAPTSPVEPAVPMVSTEPAAAEPAAPASVAEPMPATPAAGPVETVQPVQETVPQAEEPAAPQEKTVETEEDLDALLSEIRGMLEGSPVPQLNPEELEKPPQPEPPSVVDPTPAEGPEQLIEEGQNVVDQAVSQGAEVQSTQEQPEEAPALSVEDMLAEAEAMFTETPETVDPVEEPTQVMHLPEEVSGAPQPAEAGGLWQEPGTEAAKPVAEQDEDLLLLDEPTKVLPVSGMPLEDSLTEEEKPVRPKPKKQKAKKETTPKEPPKKRPASQGGAKPTQKQKKQRGTILLILVSLAIVAAAILIVTKAVMPALQNGVFHLGQAQQQEGGKTADTAETLTLDQTEVSLNEQGGTLTLQPVFAPEGSTAAVTWTSSDEKIATVNEKGVVTAVAPGTANVTAAMANGKSAVCTVTCDWTAGEPAPAEKPALSSTDVTLSGEGKTKQLTVTGTTNTVTWSSENPAVAKVAQDGTVTAVGKGSTTVTAEVDGQKLNCQVRCIW